MIKVATVTLLNFLYIKLFKVKTIRKMPERDGVLEARRAMKDISKKIVKTAKVDLEVRFLDEKAYQEIEIVDGLIIVANHESNMDIPIILSALDIPLGFIAKKEMENWMFFKTFMELGRGVFLDRENPREGIKGIKKAVKIAKDGYPLVIFPEGRRSEDGDMIPFKKGSFKLATAVNGTILPVTIDGSFYVQNRRSLKIHKNKKVILTIGRPIDVSKLSEEDKKDLDILVHKLIKEQKQNKKSKTSK